VGSIERTWKWAKRRPALAALLGVVLLALVSLAVLSGNLVVARNDAEQKRTTAEEKEGEARKEADKARKARDFLVSIFELSDARTQTSALTARQILDDAEKRIPKEFAGQPELQAELQMAIDRVYAKITENAPLAMILEASGRVQLESTRDARRPPVPQSLLYAGDRLTLAEDGQVRLVVLSDLHQEWLRPGQAATVGRRGCEPEDAITERTDDVLMTFVRLPKATFYMGWDGQQLGVKTAIPEDFEIAVHDVTQGQWQVVMGDSPSYFSRFGRGRNEVKTLSDEELKLLPVEGVSWDDAQEFIRRLNEKEAGRGYWYRLPTAEEWEYACRGGATSAEECSHHFYFEKPTNDLSSEQANFDGSFPFGKAPKGKSLGRTSRVGAYPSNKLGLCDMHGNVWQWTDTAAGSSRVTRGGGWRNLGTSGRTADGCRAADRYGYAPTTRGNVLGFRLARVPRPASGPAKPSEPAPQGRLELLRAAWDERLERDPPDHGSWYGYAELCLFLGREEEYRRARRALLERFGATTNPFEAERTARACLLLPGTDDELRQAVALAERAVAKREGDKWVLPYFKFVHGLAEYRQGQFDRAIATMQGDASGVLGPAPGLVLALSLYGSGQATEARKTFAAAILAHDWRATQVHALQQPNGWIYHILRREAEAMILPKLQAFRQGDWQPQDNNERLALLGICESEALHGSASRLCADAFAADPDLAERLHRAAKESDKTNRIEALNSECRYRAARCAALAGCGLGKESAKLSAAEQTHWRRKALEWLRTDLVELSKTLDSGLRADADIVQEMLTLWQDEPDLAGLREPARLKELAEDERIGCLALWAEVAAVLARCGNTP
jgi:formylglycine-generating enzyme required for sulfatase activity